MGIHEVTAGASWLDSNFPGWEREIDLGTFDIQDCQRCIIGQAVSMGAAEKLGIITLSIRYIWGEVGSVWGALYTAMGITWTINHGFVSEENEPIWVELLKERFGSGNLSDG